MNNLTTTVQDYENLLEKVTVSDSRTKLKWNDDDSVADG